MTDIEILRRAYERETDTRIAGRVRLKSWQGFMMGASISDINRLKAEGYIEVAARQTGETRYLLTDKGRNMAVPAVLERQFDRVGAATVMEGLSLVVGFDDVKDTIAKAISAQRKINFLLEGPPACAKSVMLEGVRAAVPDAYMAFGSRTSAAGLSEILFEHQPRLLLLDEADKMRMDVFSVLLGLMERGEILETKHAKTRGILLETSVIAACNSTARMPREFLSRFALHVKFPEYSRQEFIDVCCGFLSRSEGCPADLALLIGESVYDLGLGDIRKARGVWQLITEPTVEEVRRVVTLMQKYSPENGASRRRQPQKSGRLPGI